MNDVEKLKNAFYKVQCMNWVRNLGIGHSSAGKTLENILGKKDDYDSLPDYGSIELKTKIDGTEPFVGLISIVSDSEPLLINRLLNNYGWPSKKIKNIKFFMHRFMLISLLISVIIILINFTLIIDLKE